MIEFAARCREAAAAGHTRMPYTREVVLDADTPVSAFHKLHRGRFGFLLESLEGGERWARYSFVATEPAAVYRYTGTTTERCTAAGPWEPVPGTARPLEHLDALMRSDSAPTVAGLPRFTGGAVGFWGYDVVRSVERLPNPPADDRGIADAVVMAVDTMLVIDHLFHRGVVVANVAIAPGLDDDELNRRIEAASTACDEWIRRLSAPAALQPLLPGNARIATGTSRFDPERFIADVARCQEYIAAGDAFQIVLSRRVDVTPAPDPFLTYRWLRALNPAPYCYFLRVDEVTLVGGSPEVLVRVEEGEVTVRPIAGTRPRGLTPTEDETNAAELLADPKERAEHLMLVDLGRNDVGRVARYGSVHVIAQMVIERYSHVMHLVSEVRGSLRDGLDALDAFAAAFPAGTVSGAPKVRAMQIIDEIEPTRRGPYAGAVGYVGYGAQTLDTAIAIRTIVFKGDTAYVLAGAGMVTDSVPELELAETVAKAGAMMKALGLAQRSSNM